MPVCVPCQQASPMGFEPTISTVTGWRALQAAPRGQSSVAQVGVEPTASLVLSEGGLPIAYRADPVPGAGVEPTPAGSEPDVLPVRRPRNNVLRHAAPRFGEKGSNLHRQLQSQGLPLADPRECPVGVEPTYLVWKTSTFATRPRAQRKERESNPQGSSLGRFRDGCHRQLACPSVQAAAAGIEPAIVSLTGSRLTIGPHRKKSGRWDLNPRFPVPETGGFPGFPTS